LATQAKRGASVVAVGDFCGEESIRRAWDEFCDFLRKTRARLTQSRRIIFCRAMARPDHFRADDLANELAFGQDRVSRATVYHTLALMVKAGFIHTLRDQNKHVHYERAYGQTRHEHMICDQCGRFIEFDMPEASRLITERCEELGFQKRTYRLAVFGVCRQCAK